MYDDPQAVAELDQLNDFCLQLLAEDSDTAAEQSSEQTLANGFHRSAIDYTAEEIISRFQRDVSPEEEKKTMPKRV